MSDDFLETIWVQFAVETEEHIEGIESLLVKADAEVLNAEEISTLFRAFHSLKGLSRVMELAALESVTHRSEDLLGLVREGQAPLDKATVDLLLRALDAIKVLREKAVSDRADGDKPADLVKELEAAYQAVSGGGAVPAAAPASVSAPAPAPAPAVATQPSPAPEPVAPPPMAIPTASPVPAPKPAADVASLGDGDSDDRETVFLRQFSHGLPVLEQLAMSIASSQTPEQILRVANDIRRPMKWMLRSSDTLGYIGLHDRIQDILDALPDNQDMSRASVERMVDTIVALFEDIKTLGETSGVNLGGEGLAKVLARTLQENLRIVLDQIDQGLATLEQGGSPMHAQAEELGQQFNRIHGYLISMFPEMSSDIALLMVDAFGRTMSSEFGSYGELVVLAREAAQFIRSLLGAQGKNPLQQAALQDKHDAVVQRLRGHLWASESASSEPAEDAQDYVTRMNVPAELMELLSIDNMRDLMVQIKGGAHAYLIMAHLESAEDVASAFLGWVHDKGNVITNRTIFIDDQSWYEILFISDLPREQVQADLRQLDGGLGVIHLVSELGVSGSAAAPAAAQVGSSMGQAPVVAIAPQAVSSPVPAVASVARATGAPAAGPASGASAAVAAASNVIRVQGEMLDQFMNQIGEMVLVRGQLAHIISDHRLRETALRLRRSSDPADSAVHGAASEDLLKLMDLLDDQARRLQETDALIQGALSRLQDSVMGLRVVPVETVFKRFPRMVRDLALIQGKQIRLELTGQEVKIDKAMVESLADPLLHMVRNSVDHGIENAEERKASGKAEEAVVRIQAEQQGSRILIRVSDDGKGIDPDRVRRKAVERGLIKEDESLQLSKEDILKFIFRAGFSTAEVVTETSGRGVGMDVVRTNVMRMGGSIHLDSEVGRGTVFTMQMPLSAAVQEVLLVNTAEQTLAIPGRYVAELVEVDASEYQSVKGRAAILLRGHFLPIVKLEELLGFPAKNHTPHRYVVVLSDGQRTLGISVSEFVGRQELFTKDIHPRLAALPGVGGASILGDGRVVLILDGAALYRLAENLQVHHDLPLAA